MSEHEKHEFLKRKHGQHIQIIASGECTVSGEGDIEIPIHDIGDEAIAYFCEPDPVFNCNIHVEDYVVAELIPKRFTFFNIFLSHHVHSLINIRYRVTGFRNILWAILKK